MALLTLDEAKRQLDIETGADDLELQVYVDALTDVVERYIGPVVFREVTETIEGRGCTMCLSSIPVTALVSVTPLGSGSALDVNRLDLDPATGIVRYLNGSFSGARWRVVYSAGRVAADAPVPPTIKLASAILLQHLWRTQFGSARGQGGSDDYSVSEPIPGFGYAVPNRVLQLLEPFKLPPGVA
jgi:hypothetical protein